MYGMQWEDDGTTKWWRWGQRADRQGVADDRRLRQRLADGARPLRVANSSCNRLPDFLFVWELNQMSQNEGLISSSSEPDY